MTDQIQQAQVAILRYLSAHQDARDTIRGIEMWWAPPFREYGMAEVAAALEILAAKGLIQVWKSTSFEPVYGRGSVDPRALDDYLRTLE